MILKPSAIKQLDGLNEKDAKKVATKIDLLETDASPIGAKKLKGHDGLWRLRFGDYRIIYTAPDDEDVIRVLKIANRANAYRLL